MCKKIIIFLLFTSLLLTGCWDNIEIEDRAHISAIGIDGYNPQEEGAEARREGILDTLREDEGSENSQFRFTFAFPNEKTEGGKDTIIDSVGDTLYSISRILADRTSKEVFLGHLRTVIIGLDIAKDPNTLRQVLDGIESKELLSRRVVLAMTEGKAHEIINISPVMEPSLGQFISEIFRRKDRTPRTPNGSIGDILKDLHETGNTIIPRVTPGKTDVKIAGAGVINNYEFKGWLEEIETASIMILKGDAKFVGGMAAPYKGKKIPVDMRPKKPKMKLEEGQDHIKIRIEIEGDGDIEQTFFEFKEDLLKADVINEIEAAFAKEMERTIEKAVHKIQKEFRTDVLGIDRYLKHYHYDLWKEVEKDWSEIFPNIDIEVSTNIKIRRIGLVR